MGSLDVWMPPCSLLTFLNKWSCNLYSFKMHGEKSWSLLIKNCYYCKFHFNVQLQKNKQTKKKNIRRGGGTFQKKKIYLFIYFFRFVTVIILVFDGNYGAFIWMTCWLHKLFPPKFHGHLQCWFLARKGLTPPPRIWNAHLAGHAHLTCPFNMPIWHAHLTCPFGMPILPILTVHLPKGCSLTTSRQSKKFFWGTVPKIAVGP